MADSDKGKWIVLLNKSPKGPLSTAEVKALVSQRLINLNDVAMRVDSTDASHKGEWKLLWQYPEFDRRKTDEGGIKQKLEPSDPPTPKQRPQDRRAEKTQDEIKAILRGEIPEDLNEIAPEDLVSSTERNQVETEKWKEDAASFLAEKEGMEVSHSQLKWVYIGAGGLVTLFFVFQFLGTRTGSSPSTPPQPRETASSSTQPIPPEARPNPSNRTLGGVQNNRGNEVPSVPVQREPVSSAPTERERGEVDYRDFRDRKAKEEEERARRDDDALEEEAREKERDVVEDPAFDDNKKKKKRTPAKASEDEEDAPPNRNDDLEAVKEESSD